MLLRLSTPMSAMLAALLLAVLMLAAPPARPAPPDPLDARSATPTLRHRSVFDGYRRQGDDAPIGWRQANDTVGRIGGWRSYAREAAASAPGTAPSPPASASAPAPGRPAASGHRH